METLESAIHRRLVEEMGFDTALTQKTELIYHVPLDQWLTKHEYLHVYTGVYEHDPKPNPDEVMEWKWISIDTLREDIRENPDTYTKWFAIIVNEHFEEVFA
jgi:isopentenyl-diphosphate Delta-isomerase